MVDLIQKGLVVLGAPRSGTTLVATVLGAHPGVAMLFEEFHGAMFHFIGGKLPAVKLCTPNEVDLDRSRPRSYAVIERSGWLRKHIGYRVPLSRLSLRDMAKRAEIKALCLLRDPQQNLTALKKRENRTDEIARDILRQTYQLYRRLPGERGIDARIVSFDRFLREPEPQSRTLCDWLGLPFDAAMLEGPRLNPVYPEAGFRTDKAADELASHAAGDPALASLQEEYRALLAQAI